MFLRSQHLAFIGRTNPALAHRFIRRCRTHAVEQPWDGSRLRLCRIAALRIYRVLGVEHLRHRRAAAPEVVLRRLLSLDYVLDHLHAAWLPTEDEKVNAATTAGIARDVLPRRLYQGAVGGQYRYFPHKLPVALDTWRATFVFVQTEDETENALGAVAWDQQHLDRTQRVVQAWTTRDPAAAKTEAAGLRLAIADSDWDTVERHGGLNEVMSRIGKRAEGGRIDGFTLWGSERCRQIGAHPTQGAWCAEVVRGTEPFTRRRHPPLLWPAFPPRCQNPHW